VRRPRVDVKRTFDFVLSGVALGLTWPLLLLIGAVVRLGSRGPAFYRQERVGLYGKTFRIHKFRSMRVDHDGVLLSVAGDSRVTPVGRLLRRSKFDELPQLIDVLYGNMSFVGPRPEVPKFVALWPRGQREVILSVRPGITDPASILFRDEARQLATMVDFERYYVESLLPKKTSLYVQYVSERTFFGDLSLLLQTAVAVISR